MGVAQFIAEQPCENYECQDSPWGHHFVPFFFFKKYICIDFREEERREKSINDERESLFCCLLQAPHWGSSLQPGHGP